MKTSNDERKALQDENEILQDENEILKATIDSIKRSLESVTRANHDLEQYTRRECVEIRGIPVAANPWEDRTNSIVKDVGKLLGVVILLKTTYQFANECLKGKPQDHRLSKSNLWGVMSEITSTVQGSSSKI